MKSYFFVFQVLLTLTCTLFAQADRQVYPMEIPVVVVKYFPVKGENIDIDATGDWGKSLEFTQHKTDSITRRLVERLEEGSRYHAYKNSAAQPSLKYTIAKTYEFREPLPTISRLLRKTPMTDYAAIVERINGKDWRQSALVGIQYVRSLWRCKQQ